LKPDPNTIALLEAKLDELGPPISKAELKWPFDKTYGQLTPDEWEIARSRHLTALITLNALKSEVVVLTEVIQSPIN
jgi:hypothetical protein